MPKSINLIEKKFDIIYIAWKNMKARCTNPNHSDYKYYGNRGITVCDRWLHSFVNFLEDMIKGWKSGLTLERIKNDKGYYPDNCYWATRKQQNRNKRNNHLILCFDKIQCIAAWSEETGIPSNVIKWRINHSWPPELALIIPIYNKK